MTKCNQVIIDTKSATTKSIKNQTLLEFIPIRSARIVYIETLKTDFDKLIYNCGGVLGLWFGLSAVNLPDLVLHLPKILIEFKSKTKSLVIKLLYLIIRFLE